MEKMSRVCLRSSAVLGNNVREALVGRKCYIVCACRSFATCYKRVSGYVASTPHVPRSGVVQNAVYPRHTQATRCYTDVAECSCGSKRSLHRMGPSFSRRTHMAWSLTASVVGRRSFSRYTSDDLPPTARTTPPWRTLFFGTDWFALQHLKMLNLNRQATLSTVKLCQRFLLMLLPLYVRKI